MNDSTGGDTGAEPTTISLTQPPSCFLILRNIILVTRPCSPVTPLNMRLILDLRQLFSVHLTKGLA